MIRTHITTYSYEEKMEILNEYLSSGLPMDVIQRKYHMGHCTISKWLTKFDSLNSKGSQIKTMAKNNTNDPCVSKTNKEELELKEKIKNLEKELKHEKLKTLALETAIDVAEKELKIDIRKKAGARQ